MMCNSVLMLPTNNDTNNCYITCIRPCYSCRIRSSNIKNNTLNVAYIYKDELAFFINIR